MAKGLQVAVVFEEDEKGGYTVTSPGVPGCVSYGKTIEEAKRNFQKALKLHLACLKAHSKSRKVPEPKNIFTAVLHLMLIRMIQQTWICHREEANGRRGDLLKSSDSVRLLRRFAPRNDTAESTG